MRVTVPSRVLGKITVREDVFKGSCRQLGQANGLGLYGGAGGV